MSFNKTEVLCISAFLARGVSMALLLLLYQGLWGGMGNEQDLKITIRGG